MLAPPASILLATAAPARPFHQLWLAVSRPDNVAVLLLLAAVGYFTFVAVSNARRNDRLIAQGRKKEILKSMQE